MSDQHDSETETETVPTTEGTATEAVVDELTLEIRTANRDRKAEIGVDSTVTIGEILEEARSNWALPNDYEYIIRCERLGRQLSPNLTMATAGIVTGDILEIQPIADAGSGHHEPT